MFKKCEICQFKNVDSYFRDTGGQGGDGIHGPQAVEFETFASDFTEIPHPQFPRLQAREASMWPPVQILQMHRSPRLRSQKQSVMRAGVQKPTLLVLGALVHVCSPLTGGLLLSVVSPS